MSANDVTIEQLAKLAKVTVEVQGEGFTDPEDDWMPLIFTFPKGDQAPPAVVGVELEDKQEFKHVLLPYILIQGRARMAALVLSTYISTMDVAGEISREKAQALYNERKRLYGGRMKDWPKALRREGLLMHVYERASDRYDYWWADINRFEDKPPTLGEWVDQSKTHVEGRYADLLRFAFRRAEFSMALFNGMTGKSNWEEGIEPETSWDNDPLMQVLGRIQVGKSPEDAK